MSNGNDMIIVLKVDLIKKTLYKNESIFSWTIYNSIKVKTDLFNYATKTDLKNISQVDTSSFVLKKNLTDLKTEFDKFDIDKLAQFPVDLSKLSDAVKNDVVKKTIYDKLVAKVDNIDTIDFVLKSKYQTDKT